MGSMLVTVPPQPHRAFLDEQPWQFAFGHVFKPRGDLVLDGPELSGTDVGYWRCDIARGERLSWTGPVYELFGLPVGNEIARGEAVGRYREGSRAVLERLRTFAIDNRCGFLLDARMSESSGARGIRILSAPLVFGGRVVAIHGLKRAI